MQKEQGKEYDSRLEVYSYNSVSIFQNVCKFDRKACRLVQQQPSNPKARRKFNPQVIKACCHSEHKC